MEKKLTYAVDFGTSNSLLAAARSGSVIAPIELDWKHKEPTILRSLMYFAKNGDVRFGQDAIKGYTEEDGEGRFVRSIKKYLPAKNFTGTQINNKFYQLEDLVGCFLRELKSRADDHFQADVRQVVLGRPAKFSLEESEDRLAEKRLKEAAESAGFDAVEFFPEPLAAAYDYRNEITEEKLVLVVDLGGGTSDFTVIKIHPEKFNANDVLSLGGISIAGDVLDGCIMTHEIAPHFGSEVKYRLPMSQNVLTMPSSLKYDLSSPADITLMSRTSIMGFLNEVKRCAVGEIDQQKLDSLFSLIEGNLGFALFEEIEKCKRGICEKGQELFSFIQGEIEVEEELTYEQFVRDSKEKVEGIFKTLDETLVAAQVSPSDIDSICCTGGTSKVPLIRDELSQKFGVEKISTFKNFHSVIHGLAERAVEISK